MKTSKHAEKAKPKPRPMQATMDVTRESMQGVGQCIVSRLEFIMAHGRDPLDADELKEWVASFN